MRRGAESPAELTAEVGARQPRRARRSSTSSRSEYLASARSLARRRCRVVGTKLMPLSVSGPTRARSRSRAPQHRILRHELAHSFRVCSARRRHSCTSACTVPTQTTSTGFLLERGPDVVGRPAARMGRCGQRRVRLLQQRRTQQRRMQRHTQSAVKLLKRCALTALTAGGRVRGDPR